MITESSQRVPEQTAPHVNEKIRIQTERRVAGYAAADRATLDRRIEELDREWDVERTLQANAAAVGLLGLALGTFANRKWFVLPAVVSGFLLQHALQGWCPPLPLFRRLGVRTRAEIDRERYALKVLRGDFEGVETGRPASDMKRLLEAVDLRPAGS